MKGRNDGRVGGLRLDPEVQTLIDSAAINVASLTRRQRYDRRRTRLRLDLAPWIKETLKDEAAAAGTSANQLGAFLLAWALAQLRTNEGLQEQVTNAKQTARSLRIDWDLPVPDKIRETLTGGAD